MIVRLAILSGMDLRLKQSVAFLKKSSAKNFYPEITVFETTSSPGQKFLGGFFKKAASFFLKYSTSPAPPARIF
jgi:hypothetical protein